MYEEEIEVEKILLLDLLQILKQHSDDEHRITQHEIIAILEKDYDTKVKRKTVKTNIEKLLRYGKRQDANEILYSTKKRNSNAITSNVYSDFGFVHTFTHSELRLIIDSILFSKNMPSSQKDKLLDKLKQLSSKYFKSRMKHIQSVENKGPKNKHLFYNIETIDTAISNSVQIAFTYNKYIVDENLKLQLGNQINRDGVEREYIINPYQMVAANGRYYLICNNDKYDNISHYRLDRITNIRLLSKKRKPTREVKGLEGDLNLPKHMTEHIYMFTGQSTSVSLRFNKHFLNEFIDWFGTENIIFSNQTEDEVTARVNVNEIAMRKWALQYGLHIKVLSPKSLVERIKQDVNQVWKNYFE